MSTSDTSKDWNTKDWDGDRVHFPVSFYAEDACAYGVDSAILIYDYLLRRERGDLSHLPRDAESGMDGVFYSWERVAQSFPFWTRDRFWTALSVLVSHKAMDYASRDPLGLVLFLWDPPALTAPTVSAADEERQSPPPEPPPARKARRGYVYLLRSQDGLYKIGKSKTPNVRIKALGVVLPFDITPVHVIYSRDYDWAEGYLHAMFEDRRVRGEWFRLTEEDVAWIEHQTELAQNTERVDDAFKADEF